MADNKYGHVFTEADVLKILEYVLVEGEMSTSEQASGEAANWLSDVMEENIRFKFAKDEPLFILRGRDKRAIAAIRFYHDHQSPSAPVNHMDAIGKAIRSFDAYREQHPGELKEPD